MWCKPFLVPWWNSLGLQDSSSALMGQLIFFHDHTMVILILIMTTVGYMMISMVFSGYINRSLLESQLIEMIWTILPAMVLLFIAFPSLRLLYLLDEVSNPGLTIKVVGHQWYWSYEYSDFSNMEFDSYLLPVEEMKEGSFRSLEVDSRTIIPYLTQIRLLVTAADVIHSWTIPSLGVKVDAVPGRLNQLSFLVERPGVLFGQCSEICGANHSFMPIALEAVTPKVFLIWLSN
uniref:Cytochrome c oxidase subunit 2 n=1 Tax=Porcellio dilatatus dilatatus TaxID=96810 RepID=A0A1P8DKG5_PORDI|nr:cytochrome oxidase subunit 2 [Porcellio dilatatus dilatatus]